jgi:2-polyprenyl-3-methyl-5-hydroxy-6-metoxy-1,4-benzoquinol methylase
VAETEATAASIMTAHAYQRSVQQFVKVHSGNPKRGDIVNKLIDKLSGYLNKKIKYPVVLDAGCGPGDYLREMAQRNWRVYGIDISSGMVRYCKEENERSAKDYNITVDIKDIEQLPKEWNDFFDAVISVTVFQHLRDNKAINVLRQLTSALKPGGVIYIDVQLGRTRGYDPDLRFIEGYMNKDDVFKRLQIDEIGLSIIHTEEWTLPAGNNTFRRPIEFKFLEIWLEKK